MLLRLEVSPIARPTWPINGQIVNDATSSSLHLRPGVLELQGWSVMAHRSLSRVNAIDSDLTRFRLLCILKNPPKLLSTSYAISLEHSRVCITNRRDSPTSHWPPRNLGYIPTLIPKCSNSWIIYVLARHSIALKPFRVRKLHSQVRFSSTALLDSEA